MQSSTINNVLLGGIGVLMVAFIATLSFSLEEHMAVEGKKAPGFSIQADNGRTITPANFGGRLLVLNFWATWCQPCVDEVPSLDALQRRFAKKGLVVLGVSVDENPNLYKQFLAKNNISLLTVRQPSKQLSQDYGTFKYPESYLIDQSGIVIRKVIGKEDWNDERVISYVQSLL
jgi:cytochrome c biogenesis protein CcmG/thiol:disulfide interchange protein DsbE